MMSCFTMKNKFISKTAFLLALKGAILLSFQAQANPMNLLGNSISSPVLNISQISAEVLKMLLEEHYKKLREQSPREALNFLKIISESHASEVRTSSSSQTKQQEAPSAAAQRYTPEENISAASSYPEYERKNYSATSLPHDLQDHRSFSAFSQKEYVLPDPTLHGEPQNDSKITVPHSLDLNVELNDQKTLFSVDGNEFRTAHGILSDYDQLQRELQEIEQQERSLVAYRLQNGLDLSDFDDEQANLAERRACVEAAAKKLGYDLKKLTHLKDALEKNHSPYAQQLKEFIVEKEEEAETFDFISNMFGGLSLDDEE